MDIGFCGIGRMGAAMVARLLDQGHRLTIWNRSAEKAAPLLERGAVWAASPVAVAAASPLVITILTDAKAIEAVYDGADGLLAGSPAGKLFIEMSTVTPDTTRALAERVRAMGAGLVECPVSGTVGPAREGRLLGLAGGEPADFARAHPILEQLCRRVDHLGPVGNGAAMKLAVNLPLVVYWEALGEAMSLVRDAGIDPNTMMAIFGESSGGTNALKTRAAKIVTAMEGTIKPEVGFDIDGICKDLRTMVAVARQMGFEMPVAAQALQCYETAAQQGWGDRDGSTMAVYRLRQAQGDKG
jgi:3-hydroxyisobutyrate dehydrogenase